MSHGTSKQYMYGCRCEPCRDAGRAYRKARAESVGVPETNPNISHGKGSTYTSLGCRCELCREAHRLAVNKFRATRAANLELIAQRNASS